MQTADLKCSILWLVSRDQTLFRTEGKGLTEQEVSWDISWNTAESKSRVQKGRKSYFAIVCTIAMWRHGWIYMTN